MLRLLGGSKGSSSSSSSSKIPIVSIHVPAFGGIFLDAPTESGGPDDYVAPDREYRMIGEIEVEIPLGFGRKRCRGVKVGYRSTINLDLGPGRMGEEDILFDRRGEVLGGSTEGLWLEEGSQKFDFTIMIPSNLAPHDWHTNGSIKHRIYALVVGLPTPASSSKSKSFPFKHKSPAASRSRSRTPRSHGSRSHSRSNSPAPSPPLNLDVITAKLSLDGSQTSLPVLPAYQDLEQEDDWLYGTYEAKRTSMLVYNPKPQGGVTELDDRSNGFVPGLGVWDTRFFSDSFSISALLEAQLRISSLTPATTVFAFRISLAQTHTIISPRDDPATAEPITSTRYFVVLEEGKKPPKGHVHPSTDWPAMWRGTGAEGRDTDNLDIKVKGRLPNDTNGRPSTMPGVVTPIKVSHSLLAEVFFSVYGEDEQGKPMPRPGAGGLRLLRINRPVLVPSCALMPHAVDPPAYDETETFEPYRGPKYDKPCSLCGTRPSKRFCETCPKATLLHPRHDHDPKKVGDPKGRCPLCSKNVMPTGEPQWHHQHNDGWHFCACGMPFEEMDERMRLRERQARNGVTAGNEDLRASANIKEEAEQRGRSRRLE